MPSAAVFTDLDGTLLNHDDYSYAEALPAIAELRRRRIPLILVSSKTRAEMAQLCAELEITDPFVCENGSVIVVPPAWADVYPAEREKLVEEAGALLDYRGANRERIVQLLKTMKDDFAFSGFADMTVQDVMDCTGLSEGAAAKAMQRCASEPLFWRDSAAAMNDFAQQLGRHGLRVLKGGRFYHVMGECDKGDAVRYLLSIYESHDGAKVGSVALGDSPNDLQMLKAVDQAVVMPHPDGTYMHDDGLAGAIHAPFQGAKGWQIGVQAALSKLDEEKQ